MHDFPKKNFLVYGYKHKYVIVKWRGYMSNECRRVITLHALTEIRRIEENISISHQRLTYAGRDMVAIHVLPDHNTQESTGKVIYKPSVLNEKQLHLK